MNTEGTANWLLMKRGKGVTWLITSLKKIKFKSSFPSPARVSESYCPTCGRSSRPGSRRPLLSLGGPRARRAARPGAPHPRPGSILSSAPEPGAKAGRSAALAPRRPPGAGDDAPRRPGQFRGPRLYPAPRAAPTRSQYLTGRLPLSGHPRPPPGGCRGACSPPVGWRRRGGGRAPPAASAVSPPPVPEQGCCRRLRARAARCPPRAWGRRRRHGRAEATVSGHYWRDAPAPTAARGGGACTPLGGGAATRVSAPPPAPPRAPPPEAARAPPPSPLEGRRASGAFRGAAPWSRGERAARAGLQRRGWCFRGESRREAHLGRSRKSRGGAAWLRAMVGKAGLRAAALQESGS